MNSHEENKNSWRLAILTEKEQEKIQRLEKQLGIALIAYNDMDKPVLNESPKGV